MKEIVLENLALPLLNWYKNNARNLPWREDNSPYRVWVSEIMLQQTRVEAGRNYFLRFVAELPDPEALANVRDERLMKLWEGLGYYTRARNLKKAAGIVMEKHGGQLPASYEELLALPGIGPYTAGAIASIAFGIPVPAVDGNVLRVLARLLASCEDIALPTVKKQAEAALRQIMPPEEPGNFNQALMELGALICIPNGGPKCSACPVSGLCRAFAEGIQEQLPVRKNKKERRVENRTLFLLYKDGRLLLHKRKAKGLLAGLWELPGVEGHLSAAQALEQMETWGLRGTEPERLPPARHIFSHIQWEMIAWQASVQGDPAFLLAEDPPESYSRDVPEKIEEWTWAAPEELQNRYSLPSAFRAYIEKE